MKSKNLFKLMMLLFVATTLTFTACHKDDDTPDTNYYQVMTDYMKANAMDLSDVTTSWIIKAADVNTAGTETFYIIDLRSAEHFNEGHIAGAHNTTLSNILTEAANADKPILVVCYTGQTAATALVALRLSGYATAKSLMFGMSSWNADFDKWTTNIGNIAVDNANWSTTNTIQSPVNFSEPEFTAQATTGAEILKERVNIMISEGFKGIAAADVLDNPTNYFINNYWGEADVDLYGHISGAYRVKEDLTLAADGFKHLDNASASTVVTYCWTGQTSSLVTAYLTVLGYNAKSLKFGANGMIYDQLQAHKWTSSNDFPYEQ